MRHNENSGCYPTSTLSHFLLHYKASHYFDALVLIVAIEHTVDD